MKAATIFDDQTSKTSRRITVDRIDHEDARRASTYTLTLTSAEATITTPIDAYTAHRLHTTMSMILDDLLDPSREHPQGATP